MRTSSMISSLMLLLTFGLSFSTFAQTVSSNDACQEAIKTGGWCISTTSLRPKATSQVPHTSLSDQTLVNQALLGAAFGKGMQLTSGSGNLGTGSSSSTLISISTGNSVGTTNSTGLSH